MAYDSACASLEIEDFWMRNCVDKIIFASGKGFELLHNYAFGFGGKRDFTDEIFLTKAKYYFWQEKPALWSAGMEIIRLQSAGPTRDE